MMMRRSWAYGLSATLLALAVAGCQVQPMAGVVRPTQGQVSAKSVKVYKDYAGRVVVEGDAGRTLVYEDYAKKTRFEGPSGTLKIFKDYAERVVLEYPGGTIKVTAKDYAGKTVIETPQGTTKIYKDYAGRYVVDGSESPFAAVPYLNTPVMGLLRASGFMPELLTELLASPAGSLLQ